MTVTGKKRLSAKITGGETMNTKYEECLKACLECLEACNVCFDACLKENHMKMMADCNRLNRECADICAFAAQAMTRNSPFTKQILELCATVCERCAKECSQHDHDHCQRCAESCRKCAEACRQMAG